MSKRNAKGEGTFIDNPDGTITHRKSVGYTAEGKRKILYVKGTSKAYCIREMRKKEAEWKKTQNCCNAETSYTVTEICKMHLEHQQILKELKPKSIDRRETTINKHIGEYPIGQLQAQTVTSTDIVSHINTLIDKSGLSASSIEKVVDVLNAAYKWANGVGTLSYNPVQPVKDSLDKRISRLKTRSDSEADVVVLSPEEERAFREKALERCKHRDKYRFPAGLYGLLLLYTGMRVGEMIALRYSDLDMANKMLSINKSRGMAKDRSGCEDTPAFTAVEGTTKNEKARTISLTDEAIEILQLIIKSEADINVSPDDYIVLNRNGKPETATNLEHRMKNIYHKAGITHLKGGLHIFRRTFATNMYEEGARIKDIAAYIGDLESTVSKYYIAARKKTTINGMEHHYVPVPHRGIRSEEE